MNKTNTLIKKQYNSLPRNLQRAINKVPWKTLVQEIGKKNALDAEQLASLELETMFIIYTFESPDEYVSNLMREVGLSKDEVLAIIEFVAGKIFDPILKESENNRNIIERTITPNTLPPPSAQGYGGAMEIALENFPMVEEGEVAHSVQASDHQQPQASKPESPNKNIKSEWKKVSLPDYRYAKGKDPYREPLT